MCMYTIIMANIIIIMSNINIQYQYSNVSNVILIQCRIQYDMIYAMCAIQY